MATTNHISLDHDMQVVLLKPKASTAIVAECIALMLCVFSCVYAADIIIDFPNKFTLYFYMLIFCVGIINLLNLRRHRVKITAAVLLGYLLIVYHFIDRLIGGFWIINGKVITAINLYLDMDYGYYIPDFTYQTYISNMALFIYMVLFLLTFLFGICVVNRSATGVLILMAPFAYSAFSLSKRVRIVPIMVMLLGFFLVFSMSVLYTKKSGKRINSDFLEKKKKNKTHFHFHNHAFQKDMILSNSMVVAFIVLSIIIAVSVVVPRSHYKPENSTREFFQQIISNIADWRFGFNIGKGTTASGGIGNGVLGEVDKIRYTNETQLVVKADYRIPMYLKGFVGAQYGDNRWDPHSEEIMEANKDLFIGSRVMVPLQNIESLFWQSQSPNTLLQYTLKNDVLIENIAANPDYYYVPYFLAGISNVFDAADLNFEQDTMIKTKENKLSAYLWKSYLFKISKEYQKGEEAIYTAFYDPTIDKLISESNKREYFGIPLDFFDRYREFEQQYHQFVQQEYTRLPNDKLSRLKTEAEKIDQETKEKSIAQKVKAVAAYLARNTKYSLSPGRTPKDKDFAEYFLFENQEGYCVHYATTATLMLRAMGIPTRYVEGYTVTDKDYIENEATIRDTNAHAWIEVYMSPLGWVPFEVTPGFSQTDISETNTDNANNNFDPMKQPQPTSSTPQTPNIGETDTSDTAWEKFVKVWVGILNLIVVLLMVMAIAVIYYIFKRHFAIQKRKKVTTDTDFNRATVETYQYISVLLGYVEYYATDYPNEQAFAKYVDEHCRYVLQKGIMQKAVDIALKAKYSNHAITQEEFQTVNDFANTLAKNIYESQKGSRKIKFKYIKALY